MPNNLRQHLAERRVQLVAHSAALRQQLSDDAAHLRRRANIVKRLMTLVPVVPPLIARFWPRRKKTA
jgi:hypothetical protein